MSGEPGRGRDLHLIAVPLHHPTSILDRDQAVDRIVDLVDAGARDLRQIADCHRPRRNEQQRLDQRRQLGFDFAGVAHLERDELFGFSHGVRFHSSQCAPDMR